MICAQVKLMGVSEFFNDNINLIYLFVIIISLIGIAVFVYLLIKENKAAPKAGMVCAIKGSFEGNNVPIKDKETIYIGRDGEYSNIVLDEGNLYVSRRHCAISYNCGTYTIVDLSSNGVFIDGNKRIEINKEVKVEAGTRIYIGSEDNIFLLK